MASVSVLSRRVLYLVTIVHALSYVFGEGRRVVAFTDKDLSMPHKAAVKTTESEDGDVHDCVDIYKQPAFDHPLLKDHEIQMQPSSDFSGMIDDDPQYELTDADDLTETPAPEKEACPQGTIPIRRTGFYTPQTKYYRNPNTQPRHEYAAVYTSEGPFYGAQATISLRHPKIEENSEFSLSQIWVASGNGAGLNTIEAGWTVDPAVYGDSQTRFFVYWTSDNYARTGCYDLKCAGFVQTNRNIAIGTTLRQLSVHSSSSDSNSKQYEVAISIFRDEKTQHWWVMLGKKVMGYFPTSIFNALADSASRVTWGGEITNTQTKGHHTSTQMGNGHFPSGNSASYFKEIGVMDASLKVKPPPTLTPIVTNPKCYNLRIVKSKGSSSSNHFFYGGPGYSPSKCP